jgi:hypothetical protein
MAHLPRLHRHTGHVTERTRSIVLHDRLSSSPSRQYKHATVTKETGLTVSFASIAV